MSRKPDGSSDPQKIDINLQNISNEQSSSKDENDNESNEKWNKPKDFDDLDFLQFEKFSDYDDIYRLAFNFDNNDNNDNNNTDFSITNVFEFNNSLIDTYIETTQPNIDLNERSSLGTSTRGSKIKVDLSKDEHSFKEFFYKIFTTKARFPKKLVCRIHNIICKALKLPRISRNESRSIDLYFKNYTKESNRILIYLHQHKEELLGLVPELLNLK